MKPVTEIPEEELGVELDVAIDTAVDAAHVWESLDEIQVQLDTFADNGDFTAQSVEALRLLQSDVRETVELFKTVESTNRDRADRIRERIKDVQAEQ